ncbi:MAG TPA: MBL fold metallo-hydrolase, partial [Firmicutes bacterium]|nr:MBL fold metallo-hydrolase [Bacillota bacterium]
ETYGLKFIIGEKTVSFIADTLYFPGLAEHYRADILVLNVVLYEHPGHKKIEHLDLADAEKIISLVKPQKAILTHFGTTMIKNDPSQLAEKMAASTGCAVIAAEDGMKVFL